MKTLNILFLSLLLALPFGNATAEDAPVNYTRAEIDQMLAPIALYPDTVLSHILIAATYPLEVVQAERWVKANPGLEGEAAVNAVENRNWDPSVKALVAFPSVLERMVEDLDWTQRLGEAFMAQEGDVVEAVQGLRARAYAAGNLETNDQVRVVREREIIYVEPAKPNVIFVPYYDTRMVYGPWWWSAYPPVYWYHPPGFYAGLTYYWGPGYRISPSYFYFSSFHWSRRQVVVVNNYYYRDRPRSHFRSGRDVARYDGSRRWAHNPRHRRGVSYNSPTLSQQYNLSGRYGRLADRIPQQRGDRRQWAADRRDSTQFSRDRRQVRQAEAAQSQREAPRFQRREAPSAQRQAAPQVQQRETPQVYRQAREAPRFQRREAPTVQRQAPQVQQRETPQVSRQAREVPRFQRREAPTVQRQAPQVQQRQAPQVQQRETPQVYRQAPRVQAPTPQVQRPTPPQRPQRDRRPITEEER
jgi:hypothetical protein